MSPTQSLRPVDPTYVAQILKISSSYSPPPIKVSSDKASTVIPANLLARLRHYYARTVSQRRDDLPSGTVTFLFTDIEGSTSLLHQLGAGAYADALAEHRQILREAIGARGGIEVDTQGDAFFVAFPTATGAVAAAVEAQERLASGPIRVRMGLHTGTPHVTDEGYVGADVHKGARIASAGHGGQVLLSQETHNLVDIEVTDLHEHRLKDFEKPVWIFQLGTDRFPPLKTISNTNLPKPLSTFVGRQREVSEIAALFRQGARLVSLTGPGGSGKTRLAIEVASDLLGHFTNGTFWVGLASLKDAELVPDTIAQTMGAKSGLAQHIGSRQMLLVLDNLEQITEAAPELSELLAACPNLALFVTSREFLRISGEIEYHVPPLAEQEATELFFARSGLQPDAIVAELCRRLDNLPLAVELAAARAKILTPQQMVERLSQRLDLLKGGRGVGGTRQTLRATIDWSHELLTDVEKSLFARMAVFEGGASLEAAEDAALADLDILQSLVEKSLVRSSDQRFWMLETIHAYAWERLTATGKADQAKDRHAQHYVHLIESAPHVLEDSKEWLDRLEQEHNNIRAALRRCEQTGHGADVMNAAGILWPFWRDRGHAAEGRRHLQNVLRADARPTRARATALHCAAEAAVVCGDPTAAKPLAEESLAIFVDLGDQAGTASSTQVLGLAHTAENDWLGARHLFERSVRLFREAGDEIAAIWVNRSLAWTYFELGELETARSLYEDNLRRSRELMNPGLEAVSLATVAMVALDQGHTEQSLSLLKESIPILRNLGNVFESATNLARIAHVFAAADREEIAAQLLASSAAFFEDSGIHEPWVAQMNAATLEKVTAQVGRDALLEASRRGRTLTVDEALTLALESMP